MKYICITEVDAVTKTPCTVDPMRTGPSMPEIKGLQIQWWDQSTWPVDVQDGVYMSAPKYYGICDDDADTTVAGVLEVLTETEFNQRKHDEFYARQPYTSWVWDADILTWNPPVPYPNDGSSYIWDEKTNTWLLE